MDNKLCDRVFDQSTNLFESMCGKKSAGWMDEIYKKTYGV